MSQRKEVGGRQSTSEHGTSRRLHGYSRSVTGRPPRLWYSCSSSCTCAGCAANSSDASCSHAVSRWTQVAALRASLSSGERSEVAAAVSTSGRHVWFLTSHPGRPPRRVRAVPASL